MSPFRSILYLISISIVILSLVCRSAGHGYQQPTYGQQQQQYQPAPPAPAYGQQAGAVPQQPAAGQAAGGNGNNLLHDSAKIHDRKHIGEHLHGALNEQDLSKMSEDELQFHYFKMHDNDNNNKLDGTELIKSLIHWHVEESKHLGANAPPTGTTKIFNDQELINMIDPILDLDDKNRDGFIDYSEFVAAQKSRGF